MSQVELFLNSISPNNRIVVEAYLQTAKPVDNYRSPFTGELLYGIDQLICRVQAISKYCDDGIASAMSKQQQAEPDSDEEEDDEEEEEEQEQDDISVCSSEYAKQLEYDISDMLIPLLESGDVKSIDCFAEYGIFCYEELAGEVIPLSHRGRFNCIEDEEHRDYAWTLHCMVTFQQTYFPKISQRVRVEFLDEFYGFICNHIQPRFYMSNPDDLKFIVQSINRIYQQTQDILADNALVQNKDDSYADDELIHDLLGCLDDTLEVLNGVNAQISLPNL